MSSSDARHFMLEASSFPRSQAHDRPDSLLDKTGTLTKGEPEVTQLKVDGLPESDVVALVAAVERESEHPQAVGGGEARGRARRAPGDGGGL
jgi:hypothetical protein